MNRNAKRNVCGFACVALLFSAAITMATRAHAQSAQLPPVPAPQSVPAPSAATNGVYQPTPILQGGVVIALYPPDSPHLNRARLGEPEKYTMSKAVPGRISQIVNVNNPSIEIHTVEHGINTGAAIILVPGGGHNFLNVASEGADFVPFFYNYGVNTIILRNRLRKDGYDVQKDAVNDAQQAIRLVRAYAKNFDIDPNKIGMMGFSAGAELTSDAAVEYPEFEKANDDPGDPLAGISARPDFVGIIYPGPTPFAPGRTPPPIPRDVPPAFIVCGASGDQFHAMWALEYFQAMLALDVPDIEMHLYAVGRHPGEPMDNGTNMTGGLTDRDDSPYGTWQMRFIDWFREMGFLQKPGVETKAAADNAAFAARQATADSPNPGQPPRSTSPAPPAPPTGVGVTVQPR
jgi:hypothetical protein